MPISTLRYLLNNWYREFYKNINSSTLNLFQSIQYQFTDTCYRYFSWRLLKFAFYRAELSVYKFSFLSIAKENSKLHQIVLNRSLLPYFAGAHLSAPSHDIHLSATVPTQPFLFSIVVVFVIAAMLYLKTKREFETPTSANNLCGCS